MFKRFINVQFLVLLVFLSSNAFAVIIEGQRMREVSPFVDSDTLVVFDIDNTLIQPNQSLGSDQWFRHVHKSYIDKGVPQDVALTKVLGFWKEINTVSQVSPVEYETPSFVRKIQERGIATIVLTSRGTDVTDITDRQLNDVKLDFTHASPYGDLDHLIEKGLRYRKGILYVSGQDKGKSLIKLFRYLRLAPKKVLFIDDLQKNVQSVETALTKSQITITNIRYGAADEKVNFFNPNITLVEWGIFKKYGVLIGDPEAIKILTKSAEK